MTTRLKIDDNEWFELQFDPALARAKYGITLPTFPSDDTQISFTGMAGRPNLEQANAFYQYAREASGIGDMSEPRILDFGPGWGRIARFFLRDARPHDIVVADTMPLAIKCLQDTGNVFQIIHSNPAPPIPGNPEGFNLIYAFSVFSHLSERYSLLWLDYLLTLLQPGGHLVFTTRGQRFINDIASIKAQTEEFINAQGVAAGYLRALRGNFPDPETMRHRAAKGEFQFYPVGHSELPEDCTGETLIPRGYLETRYRPYFVRFDEDVPAFNQSVAVLRRPG